MAKKLYDVSMKTSEDMVVYNGDPLVKIVENKRISNGDLYNISAITFGTHAGTHIDAPKHFYDDGLTIDQLSLDYFFGRAKLFEINENMAVTAAHLKGLNINKDDIILLKTGNSMIEESNIFRKEYTYLSPDAAQYLAQIKIKTLGFDYLSVEKYDSEIPATHYALLGNNIVIIEGLLLRDVPQGEYNISAFPLNIKNGNGSPARVILSDI